MGVFDQHARLTCKLHGQGFFDWVLQPYGRSYGFDRWDDTRRTSWPGGPERTDDLVAVLHLADAPQQPVPAVVEIETEPQAFVLQRLGIYGLLLSMEAFPGSGRGGEFPLVSVLVVLTGEHDFSKLALSAPGSAKGDTVDPIVVQLPRFDASATLADIVAGRTARCILPWLVLMRGGGDPEFIERWKQAAEQEPDVQLRSTYGWLALVFAELTPTLVNWQRALEGWNMRESQLVNSVRREARQEGVVEGRRSALLEVVQARLADPVPEAIRLAVEGTNDLETLARWLLVASRAQTLAEFRAAMPSS
jgi:hypothetical protein